MSLTNSLVPAKAEANQSKRSADGLDPRLRGDDHIGDPSAMRVRFADTAATFTMTSVLDIREEHARILRDVLQKLLPPHARAYVFGSRAHGGARRYSDLDLALEWSGPLGLDRLGAIAEALSESDIPYKVDIVDLATVDPSFRARIAEGCIPFETADTGG
jgi:predicted nucleotidyltransferase